MGNNHRAKLELHELLNTRICDLDLRFEGMLSRCINRVNRELKRKGIKLRAEFYFGENWGCVDRTISIEVPFHMARPELRRLEYLYREEPEGEKDLMKTLRHEYGHAINYAYEIYKDREWHRLFGRFDRRYVDLYMPNPYSKSFVKYLDDEPYYAQKHPDEDWAESFAVWLDRSTRWRQSYARTPAYRKLAYVDRVMRRIRGREPLVTRTGRDEPYENIPCTLAEYYGIHPEDIIEEKFAGYIRDLFEVFRNGRNGSRGSEKAWRFVRRCTPAIVNEIGTWLAGSNRHSIQKHLRRIEAICRHYDLRVGKKEMLEKLVALTTLVNFYVMSDIHGLTD